MQVQRRTCQYSLIYLLYQINHVRTPVHVCKIELDSVAQGTQTKKLKTVYWQLTSSYTGLISVIMRCCDMEPVSRFSILKKIITWSLLLITRLAVSEWMLISHLNQITCATLLWIKSSLYTSCIKPKLHERYNIRTSDEIMSHTFSANSLHPLEIIFQLMKKYQCELILEVK